MSELVLLQGELFFRCFLFGLYLGASYDLLRALRRAYSHGVVWIAVEDSLFSVLWAMQIIYLLQVYSGGSFRFFLLFGLLTGVLAYIYTISSIFVYGLSHMLLFAKNCSKNIKKMLKKGAKTVKMRLTFENNRKHKE